MARECKILISRNNPRQIVLYYCGVVAGHIPWVLLVRFLHPKENNDS